MLQVTAHLEPELVEALDAEVAQQRLRSRSDAIRMACADWVRRQGKRRERPAGG